MAAAPVPFMTGALTIGLQMPTAAFIRSVRTVESALIGMVARFTGSSVRTLGGVFDSATTGAINLETQLAILKTTTGLSGKELAGLGKQIQELGRTMAAVKLEDLFGVATFAGRIGLTHDKIVTFTRDVVMVQAVLKDIPAEEVALRMQQVLDVFGLGTDKALGFSSALNELDKRSKATGREILQMTNQMAGHAVILGISVQDTMALSAAMRDAGIEVAIGTTAVDQVFARMATHAEEFAAIAQTADPSITFEKFSQVLRTDAISALGMFVKGLREFDQISQFKVLDAMNLEGRRTAGTLLKLGSQFERLKGYSRIANEEFKSGASIMRDYATISATTEAQQERLANIFAIIGASIGSHLLPIINELMEVVVRLAASFSGWLETNKDEISRWAKEIAKAIDFWTLITRDFSAFAELLLLDAAHIMARLVAMGANMSSSFWNIFVDYAEIAMLKVAGMAENILPKFMTRDLKKNVKEAFEGLKEPETAKKATADALIGVAFAGRKAALDERIDRERKRREYEEHPERFEEKLNLSELGLDETSLFALRPDLLEGAISPKEGGGPRKLSGTRSFDEGAQRKPGTYALEEYYKALQAGSMETETKKSRQLLEGIKTNTDVMAGKGAEGGAPMRVVVVAGP